MFGSGRHESSSVWWELANRPRNSDDFVSALIFSFVIAGLLGTFLVVGIFSFFPSGDKAIFTTSKISFFNIRGQWKTFSVPLAEISKLEFAAVQSSKGGKIYGIRYFVNGKQQKLFTGIGAPEASHILKGLESLGADVVHNSDMLTKIQETLR